MPFTLLKIKNSFYAVIICLLLMPSTVYSVDFEYSAFFLREDNWTVKTSRLECVLTQEIAQYGNVFFLISPEEPLQFGLYHKDFHVNQVEKAGLSIMPGPWRHEYGDLKNYPVYLEQDNKYFSIFGREAEHVLTALLHNKFPVFTYVGVSALGEPESVKITASSMGFVLGYKNFTACRDRLLPYKIVKLQDQVIYYGEEEAFIKEEALRIVDRVTKYLKVLPMSRLVLVSDTVDVGQSDRLFFQRRAKKLQALFVSKGIKLSRVKIKPRFPIKEPAKEVNIMRLHVFGPDVLKHYSYRKGGLILGKKDRLRLDLLAKYMIAQDGVLTIHAHSDRTAVRRNYKSLSYKQGDVIRRYLIGEGVAKHQLKIRAYGTSRPLASNRVREGRALNRRIELSFTH